jgi:class 3 adenylate cyclase/DNA-binding winged helix-turn-helix (wHTH) protein/tetratricopeptide (TPR) repeat protein
MRYVFGDYTLDTRHYELRRAGAFISLRPKVFHLLAYLLAHRDRVIPRQELCEHLWPHQFVSDATLDACLAQVRQAVGDRGRAQRVIQTRHGYGYRVVASVEVHDHSSDEDNERSMPLTPYESVRVEPAQVRTSAAIGPALVPEVPREPPAPMTPVHPPPPCVLAGERKVVTVLVCTLANAAMWAQRLEAEALHQRMQAFFTLVLEEIERYGGTLQRVLDDGVLVLFGAPMGHEDHAQRAVLAALALQHRLRPSCTDPACPQEVLVMRLGLHTGAIIIGSLGDGGRLTFTPVGDTTHLSAWLAQQAAPGAILVSDATAQLVQADVRLEVCPLGHIPGQSNPSTAYNVIGLGPRRAPLLTHAARPLSPFVGRQLELSTLRALLRRVEAGQGQVVSLVGEPGLGKTRLVYEFWRSLGPTRVAYLEGRCVSYGQAIPYLPMREILRGACDVTDGEPPAAITAHVHRHLHELGMTPAEAAPYLLHLLETPDATAGLAPLSPQTLRIRTFAALHQLLLRQGQRQPLLVIVENLHWSDPTSQEYLAELVERLPGLPLLLVVTFRPGYRPPWMDKSYATQLALSRLGPEDSQQVVQAVLSRAQLPDEVLQDILAKADGNPLFLEELAWAVREHGNLHLPPEIPATVQAVLAARIDRLPLGSKQLLQTAAVIGPQVPWLLLQALSGLPEDELRYALRHLQAAEFLYETRPGLEGTYTFKHALTHEVAYVSLLLEHRRTLHARIMQAIEHLYPNRLAEQVERLAHHAFRGEVWDKALAYCRQAGEKAAARSAYREAVGSFEQALSALPHLPETRHTREQAIDLRFDLSRALVMLAEHERSFHLLRQAETLAEVLGDQRRLGQVAGYMSGSFRTMGDFDRAVEYGQRTLAIATALEDVTLQAQANHILGNTYWHLGDYRRAMGFLRRNVVSLEGEQLRERFGMYGLPSVRSWTSLVWCLAELGAFAEGIAYGEEGVRIAEAVDPPFIRILAYRSVGELYLRKGDVHQAIPLLERSLELYQVGHIRLQFPQIASTLGYAYALCGRAAEVRPLLEQAVAQAAAMRFVVFRTGAIVWASEAYLVAGQREDAIPLAWRALELTRNRKQRGVQAWTLRLLGEIARHREPPQVESAEAYYRQALALAEELGMRPLQAHCHLGLGTLYRQMGRGEEARAALSTAIELYRAMEMTFWLPQAEALLKELA